MLFRAVNGSEGEEVIAIAQPSHAWLSGQIVRAWGNDRFAAPAPHEEVCLGAEQHDIGWLSWEAAPTLDLATGRPHDFRQVATEEHAALWSHGVRLACGFGLYPALLVSLHVNTLYHTYFDWAKAMPAAAAAARALLVEQAGFQKAAAAALAHHPRHADHVSPTALDRNRRLVAAADWLSLAICWGVRDGGSPVTVPGVPANGAETVALRLSAPEGDPARLVLDPWPFGAAPVDLVCEGRRLRERFTTEAAMRAALDGAEPVAITAELRPAK